MSTTTGRFRSLMAVVLLLILLAVPAESQLAGQASDPAPTGSQASPAAYLPLVSKPHRTGIISGTIMHGDMEREYILYVPPGYSGRQPAPLIFNYHAYGRDAEHQMLYGDFRPIADSAGAIIVHPQGALLDGVRRWNVGGYYTHPEADDVGFTAALLDALAQAYNVDPARIYSTGFSNGGYMSYLVACQLSDRFAAVAPVAGSMTPEIHSGCQAGRPLPVLHVHGLDDDMVPYGGLPQSLAVEYVIAYWVEANGNDPSPTITQLPDLDPNDGSTAERLVYGGGDGGVTTELIRISGGGHSWPGSAIAAPGTNYDIDAAAEIWNFFAKYDINGSLAAGN